MAIKFIVLVCFFLPLLGTGRTDRVICSGDKSCAKNRDGKTRCEYDVKEQFKMCTKPPLSSDRTQNLTCESERMPRP